MKLSDNFHTAGAQALGKLVATSQTINMITGNYNTVIAALGL